jgi:hypothetical protein
MKDEGHDVLPPELLEWPIWALDVRERFVEKRFKEIDCSSLYMDEAKQIAEAATLLVRALYPGLP